MKKDNLFYILILLLFALLIWQWVSKIGIASQVNSLNKEISELQKDHSDLLLLSGIGPLRSTHQHADVKVYLNGQAIDFSQSKYQLAARFIHFEEGVGDVIHTHATGLTMGHLFKSLDGDFNNNCVVLENRNYCNENNKKLRFYVNGKQNNEYDNYEIKDLDKILVSYGAESEAELQKQLASITNLAPKYSKKE
mgnify:CR=1 FL=1